MKYLVQTLQGERAFDADMVTISAAGDLTLMLGGEVLSVFHLPEWSGVMLAPGPSGHDRIYANRPAKVAI